LDVTHCTFAERSHIFCGNIVSTVTVEFL